MKTPSESIAQKLKALEKEMHIRLPEDYKSALLDFPLPGDGEEPILYDDPDRVCRENKIIRARGLRGKTWPKELFVIGGNEAGDLYFIDLSRAVSPVFAITHEMEAVDPGEIDRFRQGFSFPSWVEELVEGQKWFLEVKRQRENKKWWEFWK